MNERFRIALVVILIPVMFASMGASGLGVVSIVLPAALALVLAAGIIGGWVYGRDSYERTLYAVPFSIFGLAAVFVSRWYAERESSADSVVPLIALTVAAIPSGVVFSIVARVARRRTPSTPAPNHVADTELLAAPSEIGVVGRWIEHARSRD